MKAVLIFSGGLDSTVLLAHLLERGYEVSALSVNYGQRHSRELEAAKQIARTYRVEHQVVDISAIQPLLAGSSQTDPGVEVPEGHYADENMKLTVVPNRNMIMLSLATAWAISLKASIVAYAAHAGDHTIYPDCRPEFCEALNQTIALADWHRVELFPPFLGQSKTDLVKRGASLKVPFELTWSCYKGGARHCGKCGTCVERREAFEQADVFDPTEYEAGVEDA